MEDEQARPIRPAPRDIDPAEQPWAGADDGQVTLDTRAEHIGAVISTAGGDGLF